MFNKCMLLAGVLGAFLLPSNRAEAAESLSDQWRDRMSYIDAGPRSGVRETVFLAGTDAVSRAAFLVARLDERLATPEAALKPDPLVSGALLQLGEWGALTPDAEERLVRLSTNRWYREDAVSSYLFLENFGSNSMSMARSALFARGIDRPESDILRAFWRAQSMYQTNLPASVSNTVKRTFLESSVGAVINFETIDRYLIAHVAYYPTSRYRLERLTNAVSRVAYPQLRGRLQKLADPLLALPTTNLTALLPADQAIIDAKRQSLGL